ncbi:glycosyltransferase family 2 protein [Bacillus tuaregi]|uniref:glycosyltransferase family 2 protein n=1 Tax=Bacillus tuaregi TaxID=1816695 RepID=UPI0008F86130|nr:glycosyltransferase family 2 protein [Bacillus tuaregi]
MPKVSIILTSYNKHEYVDKTLQSILNQTYQDFELFIMDDNSNEETLEKIKPFLEDERVHFFKSEIQTIDQRVAKTRYAVLINQALESVAGDYIAYATDDNVYDKQKVEKMVDFLESHPKAMVVYSASQTNYINENGEVTKSIVRPAKAIQWNAPCVTDHCSIMHRRTVLPVIAEKFGSIWDEDPQFYRIGDARFFWKLNHYWPFYPINEVLDYNTITPISIHAQIFDDKPSEFASKLPDQRTCKELRDSIRAMRKDPRP